METTLQNLLDLFRTLRSFNGRETVVEIEGQNRLITEPYQFDARVCWAVAKNLNTLKQHVEAFEEARAALLKGVAGQDAAPLDPQKDPAKFAEFSQGMTALLGQTVKVDGLVPLKLEGLRLDKNPIPPGTLAVLADLIAE